MICGFHADPTTSPEAKMARAIKRERTRKERDRREARKDRKWR